ncbi:MAG: SRPBCC family protein [Actinomycetota bacterium]
MPQGFVAERRIRIEAAPETVFSFFIDPPKLLRWMGTEVGMDARPGGAYRLCVTPASTMVGEFVEVDPPRFVSFTWGWEEEGSPVPPGSSLVEVTLEPDGGATLLTLRHSGLPTQDSLSQHEGGWEHFLARLATVAGGGDPGPDPWAKGGAE